MKKFLALILILAIIACCFFWCGNYVKKYNKTPLTSITYTSVDYNGSSTYEYVIDFGTNTITMRHYFPTIEGSETAKTLAVFTEEEEQTLINRLYTYGLFDIEDEYIYEHVVDGGGWSLTINYNDGTSKKSIGSNSSPEDVFSKCAIAFYDICEDGIIGYVPTNYYTPPSIGCSLDIPSKNSRTPLSTTRGNYSWNGFEENWHNYFYLNQEPSFEFEENTMYRVFLSTRNYRDYEKFKKCEVVCYDFNEELSGKELVVRKSWLGLMREYIFELEPNKIYVVKLSFWDGDFVEYTFNTKIS